MYVHSSTRGGRAGAQKLEIRALMARFRSASGLQKVEGGSVVSQDPLLWYPRWWLVRSEMVWQEGVVLLTLGPASLPVSPSPHPFPSFSLSSYFPPRDPWMGWVQSDGPCVQWWLSGRQRDAHCHVWRTPTIFNCNCDLNRSKAYKYSKIIKIITNTFCINENVSIILLQQITII